MKKIFTAACNLLLKDYTRTVAECKIGINTLLNGTAKLVGKTISKEDGTGFEEDFDPEEDAKEGFTPRRVSDRNKDDDTGYNTSRNKWKASGNKKITPTTTDSKGRVKNIVADVEQKHISAKELEKRKAVQRKGPRKR